MTITNFIITAVRIVTIEIVQLFSLEQSIDAGKLKLPAVYGARRHLLAREGEIQEVFFRVRSPFRRDIGPVSIPHLTGEDAVEIILSRKVFEGTI